MCQLSPSGRADSRGISKEDSESATLWLVFFLAHLGEEFFGIGSHKTFPRSFQGTVFFNPLMLGNS